MPNVRSWATNSARTILVGTAAVAPKMAVRLARLSDAEPEVWLSLRQSYDLWHAERARAEVLTQIPTHPLPDGVRMEIGRNGHAQ